MKEVACSTIVSLGVLSLLLCSLFMVSAYMPEYGMVGGEWHSSSQSLGERSHIRLRDLELLNPFTTWLFHRELAIGDFQDLNDLYQDTSINLPDTTLSGKILGIGWTVDITDLRCQNLSIGDLDVSYGRQSNQLETIQLDAIQFDFTCILDYRYDYSFFNGGGQATAVSDNNNANVTVAFTSVDFDQSGPTGLAIQSCDAVININSLDFNGDGLGVVSALLNVVEPLLKGFVQEKTQSFACEALNKVNASATQLLQSVSSLLEPYLNDTALEESKKSEEELLNNATNVTLLSYQDPNGTLASAVDVLIKEAGKFLGGESSGNSDLNVNELVRSYLLDEDGSLTFNSSTLAGIVKNSTLLDGGGAFTQTLVRLEKVRILGLDKFTRFDFGASDNHSLQAGFTLGSLSLEASLFWEIQPPNATTSSRKVTENLSLRLDLGQINVTATLLAAIDQNLLGSLPLGSLLNTSEILDCLFSIFYKTELTTLNVFVEDIGQPFVSGFQSSSPGLARVTNITLNAVYDMYHAVLLKALPGFFQTTVRKALSKTIQDRLSESRCQPPKISNSSNALVDLRDLLLPPTSALALGGSGKSPYGGLASFLKGFINSELLATNNDTGLPGINKILIAPLSKDQSGRAGTFQYNGDLLTVDRTVDAEALYAKIRVKVNEARVENFIIGEPLALLEPVLDQPYLLNNTATFGVNDSLPLQLRANVLFNLVGKDGFEINDDVSIGVSINDANILATALLQLSEAKFLSFPLSDFFNLHCWLATIQPPILDVRGVRVAGTEPTAGLPTLNVSTGKVDFNITCRNCTGQSVFETLTEKLQMEQGSQDASRSANRIINYATTILRGSFLQVQLDRMIAQAPTKCPHSPSYNPGASSVKYEPFETSTTRNSFGFLLALVIVTGSLCGFAFISRQVLRIFVNRRHRKWLQRLDPDHVMLIYRCQSLEQQNEKRLNEAARSMFQSPVVPVFVRWAIPVIVLGNVGLFLSGHLSVAGSVSIRAEFAGQVLIVDDFYEFSIVRSAIELWHANGKVLAILIFLVSGVWPYTKQFMTFVMWFLPPKWLSLSRRGVLFGWLDFLAKWSIVDIFFLILSLVAFRVTIASPTLSYLPNDFYKVDLLVIPLWGLYANLIAQLVSQVSAHFIVHYHRRTVEAAQRDQELQAQEASAEDGDSDQPYRTAKTEPAQSNEENEEPDRLRDHAFLRPHRGETDRLKVRHWIPMLLIVAGLATCALVVTGCVLPSLSFDARGIVGVLVQAGKGFHNTNKFSVFSTARLLIDEARLLDTGRAFTGLISIAVLFVLTTLAVPLVLALLLVAQFLLPLSPKIRNRIEVAIEILQDWQYVDVYVVSVLITTSQLGNVSAYLVNPYCSSLQDALSSLVFYGVLKSEDAQCFYVQAGIDSGTYVLLAAAVLLTLLDTFVTKAVAQYRRDKTSKAVLLEENHVAESSDEDVAKAIERIQPVPVLFTDNFRWLLQREIPHPPSTRPQEAFNEELVSLGNNSELPTLESSRCEGVTDEGNN